MSDGQKELIDEILGVLCFKLIRKRCEDGGVVCFSIIPCGDSPDVEQGFDEIEVLLDILTQNGVPPIEVFHRRHYFFPPGEWKQRIDGFRIKH